MTLDELKTTAAEVARALGESSAGPAENPPLPEELRKRFIAVRSALFQRGIYDPVLVRFDSATVARASRQQIAKRLKTVAESL